MPATNDQIMRAVGGLEEAVGGLRRDMDAATESRKTLYERNEDTSRNLDRLSFNVEALTGTVSQLRDVVRQLADGQQQMADNVRPILDLKSELPGMVESWKDVRKTGQRIILLLTIGGVTTTGLAFAFWSFFTDVVRHWLGVPPPGA